MENIIENNKLIAEFMGWKNHVNMGDIQLYKNEGVVKHIGELKYHCLWDWLMPVVEKIEDIEEGKWYVHIQGNTVSIEDGNDKPLWDYHINNSDPIMSLFPQEPNNKPIESVYKAVVEFIKWYNENKDKITIFV